MLSEREVWLLDQKINRRGVQVDTQFVARAAKIVGELTEQLNREIAQITDDFVKTTSQVKKLQVWMGCEGLPVESLSKHVITELLSRDLDARIREVLELRQEGAKSSTAKLNAMLNRTCADGRLGPCSPHPHQPRIPTRAAAVDHARPHQCADRHHGAPEAARADHHTGGAHQEPAA
jgi:hypothetical protein